MSIRWPFARRSKIARIDRSNLSDTVYVTLESRALMAIGSDLAIPSAFVGPLPPIVDTSPAIVSRIVNGTVTNQFPSVGLVGDNTGYFCSGTLIASRYVLTAAHCAEGVANSAGRFKLGSSIYSTTQVYVHPGYNPNLIGSDTANDIAIYRLDRDVTGVSPSPIYRAVPQIGQLLTLVGFGAGGTGTTGHDGSFGTKRVGTTPIDQVSSKLIHWDFDNNSESNTAPGDSGGPAFLSVNGTYHVAGVTSGGDQANAGIGDHSFDTRVDAYAPWIDSIVGSTGSSVTISITAVDASAAETVSGQTANTATFKISRTGATSSPLSVNLSRGGTATSGSDYVALPTTITIPIGATSTNVVLTPRDDTLAEGNETVVVSLAAGPGYQIDTSRGSTTLSIADNEQATSNDYFVNRRPVNGAYANVTGSNQGATKETGEPNVLGVSGGKSVWWTWTAPVNGTVSMSTSGSNYDTTLGVYKGNSVQSLTLVKANDDQNLAQGILTSKVTFSAVAGQTYQILVDGYQGATGTIHLAVDQPNGRTSIQKLVDSKSNGPTNDSVSWTASNRLNANEFVGPVWMESRGTIGSFRPLESAGIQRVTDALWNRQGETWSRSRPAVHDLERHDRLFAVCLDELIDGLA